MTPDRRTDEQRAADSAMEDAVRGLAKAYDYSGVVTGWLLGLQTTGFDEDQDETSSLCFHTARGQGWGATTGILLQLNWVLNRSYMDGGSED